MAEIATNSNNSRERRLGNGRIGRVFVLADRPALKFRCSHTYTAMGSIPCVTGVTLDGKQQTSARVVDVLFED